MGLVTGCQPLLQGEALALLCQNLRGVGIGQIGALGLIGRFLGGQLLTIGVGLPHPCSPRTARHKGEDDQQPELLEKPQHACMSAAWFWATNGLSTLADAGQFDKITRRINGSQNGAADRQVLYARALKVLA